jgi:transposase-like protein
LSEYRDISTRQSLKEEEAVKFVPEGGLGIADSSRRLGLDQKLRNGLKQLKAGKLVADTREVTEPEAGSKSELTHHRIYRARLDAIREITEHIEVFYSRQRRQPRLGVLSPAA